MTPAKSMESCPVPAVLGMASANLRVHVSAVLSVMTSVGVSFLPERSSTTFVSSRSIELNTTSWSFSLGVGS